MERKLVYHHSAYALGYVRKDKDGWTEPYKGRFGEGVKKHVRSTISTRYHIVEYWVYEQEV